MHYDPNRYYAFLGPTMEQLVGIMSRLYAPQPLTPDERRDMANKLHTILSQAEEVPEQD